MKTTRQVKAVHQLSNLRSTLLGAVGKLDLRGSNEFVTQAMCIIEATLEATLRGQYLTPAQAHELGLRLANK